jgi:hypothetical protein
MLGVGWNLMRVPISCIVRIFKKSNNLTYDIGG